MSNTLVHEGGCQCGNIRYEIAGDPLMIYVCHCRECQKQSGSAFGISVIISGSQLSLISGEPNEWVRATDSGNRLGCHFCPTCGSRVWHSNPDNENFVSVKGGSLDAPVDLSTAFHIWTCRKLNGVILPEGATTYEQEPPR